MGSRDKGMFWTKWDAFFGLRFKGELTAQGAELISEGFSLLTMLISKSSIYISSAMTLSFRDELAFLGLPDPDAPFCVDFFDLIVLSSSGTGSAGSF